MSPVIDAIAPAETFILGEVEKALKNDGRAVGLAHLAPGAEVAWDDCCKGQLWVRTVEVYPTMNGSPFPNQDLRQAGCGVEMLAVQIGVGVMRCAATLNDQGQPPSAAQMTKDAVGILQDQATVLHTLTCLPGNGYIKKLLINRWTPQGPSGSCAGGEWTAYIAVGVCPCEAVE